jgi:1-acyl-sn-glycerol-3-phosphate acyltransferase
MRWYIVLPKLALLIFFICGYFVQGSLGWLLYRDPVKRSKYFAQNVSRYVRIALWLFNIKVVAKNVPPADKNFLFIGNHLGFIDIFVLASLRPSLFITSVEMKNTPLLGQFCEMGGCFFIERRSRARIHDEINQIRDGLLQGHNIVLYPEGTSGHGAHLLPFKKSLLTSAAGTGVKIKPIVVNYKFINGEPMSHKYREFVCWYGDQAFAPAILRLLTLKSLEAHIEFLEEIEVQSEEERREVAAKLHELMSARYEPILYPEGQVPPVLGVRPPDSRAGASEAG